MRTSERERYWRQIVARHEKSGLSVAAFCRKESLCAPTLYRWRRKIARRQAIGFAVVNVTPAVEPTIAPLELLLPGGDRLCIRAGFDAASLRAVLAALREGA